MLSCEPQEQKTCGLDTQAVRPAPGCAVPMTCDDSALLGPSKTCAGRTVQQTRSRARSGESHSASLGCQPCGLRDDEHGLDISNTCLALR